MAEDAAEIRSGTSSVEVSVNAKGEVAYKVKCYEGTSQEGLDAVAEIARTTMERLQSKAL